MKNIKPLILILSSAFVLATTTGCGKSDVVVTDPTTINVRLYKAGYGDEFIYELKDKFEQVFAKEGYKVNVLTPSYDTAGDVVMTELAQGYAKTGVDLYITGAVNANMVSASGQYGELVENIEEDVFNQPCINYDGSEGKKVSEKISTDIEDFLRADDGNMYGFAWAQSTAGLVVNTTKLAKYGVTQLPRTTKELLDCCEKVYYGANGQPGTATSRVYPITYTVGFTGYSDCAFDTWHAQLGVSKFKEAYRMQTYDSGKWTDMTDGYKVFEDEDLKDVYYNAYRFMDVNFAADGSTTQKLDQAQAKIMKDGNDGAIFMFNGDWFLNEIRLNYRSSLDQIDFINTPVISTVGTKVFGANSKYKLDDAKCEELLCYIIDLVDQNKEVSEIKASLLANKAIEVDDADISRICEARGTTFARGPEHLGYITKGSTKKAIAAKFLRMMASDDYAETFMSTSNCSTPYAKEIKTTSQYKFVNSAKAICLNKYYRGVRSLARGLRRLVGINTSLPKIQYASQNIAGQAISKYDGKGGIATGKDDSIYVNAANTLVTQAITDAKDLWDTYFKLK